MRGSDPVCAISIRLSIASTVCCRQIAPTAAVSPVSAGALENSGNTIRFTRRTERTIPTSPYGSGDIVEMEHSKLVNGNGHEAQIGRSASPAQPDQMSMASSAGKKAVRKKTASRKAKLARPLRKKMGSDSKSKGWCVAIAAAKILLQVLSSGVIADAGNASVNAIARPHGRGRLR